MRNITHSMNMSKLLGCNLSDSEEDFLHLLFLFTLLSLLLFLLFILDGKGCTGPGPKDTAPALTAVWPAGIKERQRRNHRPGAGVDCLTRAYELPAAAAALTAVTVPHRSSLNLTEPRPFKSWQSSGECRTEFTSALFTDKELTRHIGSSLPIGSESACHKNINANLKAERVQGVLNDRLRARGLCQRQRGRLARATVWLPCAVFAITKAGR